MKKFRLSRKALRLLLQVHLHQPDLAAKIQALMGEEYLYFYDAAAPIVEKDSH